MTDIPSHGRPLCKQRGCMNPAPRLGSRCPIHEGTVVDLKPGYPRHPLVMDDDTIIDYLRRIDESDDIECTDWEADVLDEIKKLPKPRILTPLQRAKAMRVIEKYKDLV